MKSFEQQCQSGTAILSIIVVVVGTANVVILISTIAVVVTVADVIVLSDQIFFYGRSQDWINVKPSNVRPLT